MSNRQHRPCLARCTRGATILEFAIIAPLFFLVIIAIIELGMIFFTYSVLEGATNIGSRIGRTGFTESGTAREDFIREQIRELSGGYLDINLLNIEILSYDNFASIGQPEPCLAPVIAPCPGIPGVNFTDINGNGTWDADMGVANAGSEGAVVLYRITYPWTLLTPIMRPFLGDPNGILNITAVATVRNEPFE